MVAAREPKPKNASPLEQNAKRGFARAADATLIFYAERDATSLMGADAFGKSQLFLSRALRRFNLVNFPVEQERRRFLEG